VDQAKCKKSGSFPVIAFVEKLGASPRRMASFYIARWEDGRLLYAGKVQSGYTYEEARAVRERLDPLITARKFPRAPPQGDPQRESTAANLRWTSLSRSRRRPGLRRK
jgi:bifunctional non-homologous end joining protein LigD